MEFEVQIIETYIYKIKVEAENERIAYEKAAEEYRTANDGYVGVANATSFDNVRFKVL